MVAAGAAPARAPSESSKTVGSGDLATPVGTAGLAEVNGL